MRIVVAGGSGDLGSRVVRELAGRGHDVVAASRRSGVDLTTGAGLDRVLDGAHAVVHCATDPRRAAEVDVGGARRIAEAAARSAAPPHVVSVSIVGCDLVPYAYYRAKLASEVALEQAATPATVVRATQFHALAAFAARAFTLGRVALSSGDLAVQPVDVEWVAHRLADHAEGEPPPGFTRAVDLAGPEVLDVAQLTALVAGHLGRRAPRVLRVPPVGRALQAFARRANVPAGPVQTGGRAFAEWLATQPVPLPRGMHDHG